MSQCLLVRVRISTVLTVELQFSWLELSLNVIHFYHEVIPRAEAHMEALNPPHLPTFSLIPALRLKSRAAGLHFLFQMSQTHITVGFSLLCVFIGVEASRKTTEAPEISCQSLQWHFWPKKAQSFHKPLPGADSWGAEPDKEARKGPTREEMFLNKIVWWFVSCDESRL